MNEFEQLEIFPTPLDWYGNGIILPSNIGFARTVFPYRFSRSDSRTYLLLYTSEGEGRLNYGGAVYNLKVGDLFFIDCFKYQEYSAVSNNWNFYYIHAEDIPEYYYKAITQNGESTVFSYPTFLQDCWKTIFELIKSGSPSAPAKASICFLNLLTELLSVTKHDIPENIKLTAEYIQQNCSSQISVEILADMANLSKYHFIRCFNQYYGATPHEYVIYRRIDRAKALLSTRSESIENIADACGFSSVSSFSQCFKKATGISPSAYRSRFNMSG